MSRISNNSAAFIFRLTLPASFATLTSSTKIRTIDATSGKDRAMSSKIEFPKEDPKWAFERDSLLFRAVVHEV